MKARDIVSLLQAKELSLWNHHLLEKDYEYAFASDLMSDALALIQQKPESTVLITGLSNAQVLRTAEMLDIDLIIFVRGKDISEDTLQLAKQMGFNIFKTQYSMYETCGILYNHGLGGVHDCYHT